MVKLIFPCNYIGITQGFKSTHKAIDMGWSNTYGGPNHEIISPGGGTITYVKKNYVTTDSTGSSYGNYVKIDHGNGISTIMAHLKYNSVVVNVGDKVSRGQKIGIMGATGHATGIHCHYEVRIDNERVNPVDYTYALNTQVVTTNTRNAYGIKTLEEEVTTVKDTTETKTDNVIFEYLCTKTGMYKIELNQNEKLVIID
jgi:murein DD-endopeptidase MepM/ murein hydrolase activator NlpD